MCWWKASFVTEYWLHPSSLQQNAQQGQLKGPSFISAHGFREYGPLQWRGHGRWLPGVAGVSSFYFSHPSRSWSRKQVGSGAGYKSLRLASSGLCLAAGVHVPTFLPPPKILSLAGHQVFWSVSFLGTLQIPSNDLVMRKISLERSHYTSSTRLLCLWKPEAVTRLIHQWPFSLTFWASLHSYSHILDARGYCFSADVVAAAGSTDLLTTFCSPRTCSQRPATQATVWWDFQSSKHCLYHCRQM